MSAVMNLAYSKLGYSQNFSFHKNWYYIADEKIYRKQIYFQCVDLKYICNPEEEKRTELAHNITESNQNIYLHINRFHRLQT